MIQLLSAQHAGLNAGAKMNNDIMQCKKWGGG
jgi:hypothetical protein